MVLRDFDQNKYRKHVQTLLSGKCDKPALSELFLFVRSRCDGRQTVQDIGDFIAHPQQRNKGITTDTVRDFFTILIFKFRDDNKIIPANFEEVLRALVRQIDRGILKRDTGLNKPEVEKMIPELLDLFSKNDDGTFRQIKGVSEKERRVLECLTRYVISKPAFDRIRLVREFRDTLKSHDLLEENELRQFETVGPAIILYACYCMHGSEILLSDDSKVTLEVHANEVKWKGKAGTKLFVSGSAPVSHQGTTVNIAGAIFETCLDAQKYSDFDWDKNPGPDTPIDLTEDGRLVFA